MKHVKLFEQFIFEASNEKRIKEIQAELQDIEKEMEDVQDAMDNGDFDEDEAELRLNDLDGNKLDLEAELEKLKGGDKDKDQEKVRPVVAKTIQIIGELSYQSSKWSAMLQHVPSDKKNLMKSLKERDEAEETKADAVAEKVIAKCDKLEDKMSSDMLALYSFAKGEYKSSRKAFMKAGSALQGVKETCKDLKRGCDEVAARKKTYDEVFSKFQQAQAKLRELAKVAGVRV